MSVNQSGMSSVIHNLNCDIGTILMVCYDI